MQKDFFISRAGADKDIALTITRIIKDAGFVPYLQDKDFGHASFMAKMEEGFLSGASMISLLSSTYQQSAYCQKEYNVMLSGDPSNLKEKLIVLRIEDVIPVGQLTDLAYTDLVPVLNNAAAMERLIRVAIGAETDPKELEYAATYHRAVGQILHPNIEDIPTLVEREDKLDQLDDILWEKDSTNKLAPTGVTTVLGGFSGVGKTILARQYAWLLICTQK